MNAEASKPGLGKKLGKIAMIIAGIFVGLVVLGAIVGEPEKGGSAPKTASSEGAAEGDGLDAAANAMEAQAEAIAQNTSAAEEEANSLTGPQQNAVRSAEQYLTMSGFSRKGLINQLSSDHGEGYSVADATAAVDSLNADWNEHAARSAKQYLSMSGFSCKGLTEQLSSSYGDKYTKSEAAYGAQQAGAC